jgi:3-methylfumaryl-CoA hydratase
MTDQRHEVTGDERVSVREVIQPGLVHALAALFDDGLPAPEPGDELPPLWHWVALPRWPQAGQTGADGHPVHSVPRHPEGMPRRMFAGGRARFFAPLRVGDTVRRDTRVVSSTRKEGRQGEFVLVAVETELTSADGELAVVETQDIIYRPAAASSSQEAPAALLPQPDRAPALLREDPDGCWRFRTDPVFLARFSAATANGHRIHYDWPYATGVEGYPGLLVHGPLMTLSLLELARLSRPGDVVTAVAHRNLRPLFCGQEAVLHAAPGQDGTTWTYTLSGGDDSATPNTSVTVEVAPGGSAKGKGQA